MKRLIGQFVLSFCICISIITGLCGLIQRIKTCTKRLQAYLEGGIDDLEEIEETILPLWNGSLWGNNYASLISRSLI